MPLLGLVVNMRYRTYIHSLAYIQLLSIAIHRSIHVLMPRYYIHTYLSFCFSTGHLATRWSCMRGCCQLRHRVRLPRYRHRRGVKHFHTYIHTYILCVFLFYVSTISNLTNMYVLCMYVCTVGVPQREGSWRSGEGSVGERNCFQRATIHRH